jgi:two-component system, NarL family, response regulator NreC
MARLRILLADDHTVIRQGLKLLVNAQLDMEVIGEAGNGQEAWQRAKELQPDVVVMDISMPECNGAQATERLTAECPEIKVLALTLYEDEEYLRQLLQAGASGYVLKRAVAEDLTLAIRTVATGGVYLDPRMAGKVVGSYIGKPSPEGEPRRGDLSEREKEVLRLIAWGYSNKEIAAKLHISVKTVETYKTRLMAKLELYSRVDLVRYALQHGWLREG